ncbi:ISAs1 family transposase [Xanthobacter sp. KR7-65]|uniref:ISAs1 family transposase n=1 Tax=Xanthobacter sp. KR7-65 TaxID=3156612 RepID=UPI0032B59D1F
MPFANGTPSHDQLGLIFGALDAAAFQQCFIAWTQALSGAIAGVVAVDGKTLRRSFDRAGKKGTVHMVSAWSSAQKLTLGMRAVDEKSNEITAIPELLDLLAIKGADYVLRLKSNQGGLHEDVALLFSEQMANDFKNIRISTATDTDAGHGRIQSRQVFATDDIDWLKQRHDWAGLRSIVMVLCTRETDTGKSTERRFYIASLPADAEKLGAAIRQHWGVENSLHWMLDVNFCDDAAASARKTPRQTHRPQAYHPQRPAQGAREG